MKSKILIICALVLILVTSCNFCKNKEIGICDFTEAQKKIIPYENGQVISFIYNKADVIDFNVKKLRTI